MALRMVQDEVIVEGSASILSLFTASTICQIAMPVTASIARNTNTIMTLQYHLSRMQPPVFYNKTESSIGFKTVRSQQTRDYLMVHTICVQLATRQAMTYLLQSTQQCIQTAPFQYCILSLLGFSLCNSSDSLQF